jgi:hypothetical protein
VTRVRTTIRPDLEVEVDDTEYLDLQRMGLLVEDGPAAETPAVAPAEVPKPRAGVETKPGKEE